MKRKFSMKSKFCKIKFEIWHLLLRKIDRSQYRDLNLLTMLSKRSTLLVGAARVIIWLLCNTNRSPIEIARTDKGAISNSQLENEARSKKKEMCFN